jgi:hypothetical protein
MATHKTAELTGALLDAAVAKAEGMTAVVGKLWFPSTDWGDGGPIIERERIEVSPWPGPGWQAWVRPEYDYGDMVKNAGEGAGPTPLIAAMRAYVASKFGEEVELP